MMIVHLGVGEGSVGGQLLDGCRDSRLPDWRPENSSVGRDGAEEGEKENRKLEHDLAAPCLCLQARFERAFKEVCSQVVNKACVCIMSKKTRGRQGNNSLK